MAIRATAKKTIVLRCREAQSAAIIPLTWERKPPSERRAAPRPLVSVVSVAIECIRSPRARVGPVAHHAKTEWEASCLATDRGSRSACPAERRQRVGQSGLSGRRVTRSSRTAHEFIRRLPSELRSPQEESPGGGRGSLGDDALWVSRSGSGADRRWVANSRRSCAGRGIPLER